MEVGGSLEDSSWLISLGTRGTSRKPGLCSRKCADWCLTSLVLSVGGVGGRVSPELSVGDVGKTVGGNAVLYPSTYVLLPSRSPVFEELGWGSVCGCHAAEDSQGLEGDAVVSPE